MSMMPIMDILVMNEARGNGSAGGTEHSLAKRQPHRQYEIPWKRQVVEETFAPGSSVSIVARRHDVNANVVFAWRKQYRQGTLVERKTPAQKALPAPDLVRIGVVDQQGAIRPVPMVNGHTVPPSPEKSGKAMVAPEKSRPAPGMIEIELPGGIKVRVDTGIEESALRRVLAVIREAA